MRDSGAGAAMSGNSPAFEQVRDFPARGELVADAVGVDLLELRCVLCGKHYIAWVNDSPDARCHPWLLWLIDKPGDQPGLARQQSSLEDHRERYADWTDR